MMTKNLKNELDRRELLTLVKKLITINSENPPGDMKEISDYIKSYLEDSGASVELFEPVKGKISILSKIGEPPYLALNGHMDTVPVGDLNKWKYNPFSGKTVDGYIYGRGASDMKSGLSILIYLYRKFINFENNMKRGLLLIITGDEETGGIYGTKWILENIDLKISSCIIGEPTEIDNIEIGQKGSLWLHLKSKGESAHGSLNDYKGKNAIDNLINFYNEMRDILNSLNNKISLNEELKILMNKSKKRMARIMNDNYVSNALDHITVNMGLINGGVKVNIIPDFAEADIDIRVPIGIKTEYVKRNILDLQKKYDDILVEIKNYSEPNFTLPSKEIIRTFKKIFKKYNMRLDTTFQWASSDARYFRYRDIPTIQYGPATLEGIHSYNERIKINDIIFAGRIYNDVLKINLGL